MRSLCNLSFRQHNLQCKINISFSIHTCSVSLEDIFSVSQDFARLPDVLELHFFLLVTDFALIVWRFHVWSWSTLLLLWPVGDISRYSTNNRCQHWSSNFSLFQSFLNPHFGFLPVYPWNIKNNFWQGFRICFINCYVKSEILYSSYFSF